MLDSVGIGRAMTRNDTLGPNCHQLKKYAIRDGPGLT
jgi:hypothetical protein